jgi:AcrR family transcriptional regulator
MLSSCLASSGRTWQRSAVVTAPTPRRLGAEDSKTRARLLDAAEQLLLEEGYAAVTSRRVAAKADLKPQLVHYYFRRMDDLFIEVFRRRAEQNLERIDRAVAADSSLRSLWQLNADPRGASFMIEFVALAKHRKELRDEIARYAERHRGAQLDALTTALRAHGVHEDQLPPIAVLVLMTGLAQLLAIEGNIGVTTGHDATLELIEETIRQLEARA